MIIRTANEKDADALVDFNQAMAMETEGKALERETLTKGVNAVFRDPARGFYVVAEQDGQIAGGLMVTYEWSDWRNGWFWWIQSVYVRPEARGTGVYSRLYAFVQEKAENDPEGVCGFRLYVEKENERAMKVYEKLGMSECDYKMYEEGKQKKTGTV